MQKRSIPFKLDLVLLDRILSAISDGASTYEEVAGPLGIGKPKVRFFCYWGMVLELVEPRARTGFPYDVSTTYHQLRGHFADFAVLQLLYILACKNHLILSFIVNGVAWNRFVEAVSSFSSLEARSEASAELDLSEASLKRQIPIGLGTLTDRKGFGNLGIIRELDAEYFIDPLQPHALTAAYSIYANWPSHTAKVAISEIITGRNSIGRIFLLTKYQVMSILRELEDRGLVKIEIAASLDQIGRDPMIGPEDILEMIVAETARGS